MAKARIAKKDEQLVSAAITFCPSTVAEVAAATKLEVALVSTILISKVDKWGHYGEVLVVSGTTPADAKFEFIPDKRWFRWANKEGEIVAGFDLPAITREAERRAALQAKPTRLNGAQISELLAALQAKPTLLNGAQISELLGVPPTPAMVAGTPATAEVPEVVAPTAGEILSKKGGVQATV